MIECMAIAALAWIAGAAAGWLASGRRLAKGLILLGIAALLTAAVGGLAGAAPVTGRLPFGPLGGSTPIAFDDAALWLLVFGGVGALAAAGAGSPVESGRGWHSGVAVTLLGALGVFGVQSGAAFLVAWELMSLGGAAMLLAERPGPDRAGGVLFMLALLEVGSVALFGAILWLVAATGTPDFASAALGGWPGFFVGLLCLIGFGAKLGLLPFYEWYPGAYASGSGASGALLSGIVLNAAFFALARALMHWTVAAHAGLAQVVLAVSVISAILAALYAFQQDDWRRLLAFSSADNAAIAVSLLGSALLFRVHGDMHLAAMAWGAALLHMAGHTLAKTGLLLSADAAFRAGRGYDLAQSGLVRFAPWLAAGAFVATASLAAVPPTPGFISEWFGFQSLFHGFSLATLNARISLVLSGAGLALSGAIGVATFVKVFGLGFLGRPRSPKACDFQGVSVGLLGLAILVLAIGMPWWLAGLDSAMDAEFGATASALMRHGWLLVPLSHGFAFISPTKLAIALVLYALAPGLLVVWLARARLRRAPVWFGGLAEPDSAATTALTFANAMRRYYGFVYRPRSTSRNEHAVSDYFPERLVFTYSLAPVFGPFLFRPAVSAVRRTARRLALLQSGYLNVYLGLIGGVLLIILLTLLARGA